MSPSAQQSRANRLGATRFRALRSSAVRDRRLYDGIGEGYASTRRADPRVAARIDAALGDAASVVNVGAGTGNYEPADRAVVAVEPSPAMVAQRPRGTAPVVRAVAESLPLPDGAADATLAVLTVHHWTDLDRGLAELRRVSRRQVVLLFDTVMTNRFWVMEYFAEAQGVPSEVDAPDVDRLGAVLDVREVQPVPVPFDCTDGFGAAFWGRPEAMLRPDVQAGMSFLAQLDPEARRRGTDRLAADLSSGRWDERFDHLRDLDELDVGYRLVIAGE